MATLEARVDTLERQVVHFVSSKAIEALVDAAGADVTALTNSVNALNTTLTNILDLLQSVQDDLADHETRITALEP